MHIVVVDFYNHVNLLYGSITEFCSPQSCPEMKATDEWVTSLASREPTKGYTRFEYLWQDSENYKRPTKMPAPTYIEHLMGWVQSNVDNEAVFPSRIGMWSFYGRRRSTSLIKTQGFRSQNLSQV
jgi:MOB kinase activator 1